MSEIKVNSIKGVGASAAAITVNNSDGTCTANITNKPNRNLIINGAMQVAQRGTSSTSSGIHTVDRFTCEFSGTDETPTQAQADVASGTTPYTLGFRKSFKITNGNQISGAGASDFINIQHKLEAQDIANSGWNYTSSSSYVTLSFWIKSSVAQTFKGFLRTRDGTEQRYTFETGSLTADTWTKITKTISGNSNITINNDNGEGLQINVGAFWGGTYTDNSVTEDAWGSYSGSTRMKDNTSTWYTTNDATLEITGVQLEVGSVATDFEHRSYGQELALCQRYYETSYPYGVAVGGNDSYTGQISLSGSTNSSGTMVVSVSWNEKRTTPTVTAYNSVNGNSGSWYAHRNGSTSHTSVTIDQISRRRCRLYFGVGANWVASNAEGHFVANAEL